MIGAIYKIECCVTRDCYVGLTTFRNREKSFKPKSIKDVNRWKCHLSELRRGNHLSRWMQRDFNLYGELSFHFEMLEWVSKNFSYEKLEKAEMRWKKRLQPAYCPDFRLWIGKAIVEKIGFEAVCRLYNGDFIAMPSEEDLSTDGAIAYLKSLKG